MRFAVHTYKIRAQTTDRWVPVYMPRANRGSTVGKFGSVSLDVHSGLDKDAEFVILNIPRRAAPL